MFRKSGKSTGPTAPMKVPAPGATSSVGPKPPKLRPPPQKNTRDYGKASPAPPPSAPPFGPDDGYGGF